MHNKKELQQCKYCDTKLHGKDVKATSKKKLEPRQGIWGGMEFPYIQIYRVKCSNSMVCGQSYSVRIKGSDWLYK